MNDTNPYCSWIAGFVALLEQGQAIGTAPAQSAASPKTADDAPRALIFSPHPDDESIIGGLPLRLARELGYTVANVAVTLGGRLDRRAARHQELQNACAYLGFELITTTAQGLEHINLPTRKQQPEHWQQAVQVIVDILHAQQPDVIFLPHAEDWNRTHIGTHQLVLDALCALPSGFTCQFVETEFWGAMATPNLLVASNAEDVADLVAALSLHVGEVARNPYHLRLPAWMVDNVRRGGELVGGQGAATPNCNFATLYRLQRWADGSLQEILPSGRQLIAADELRTLFV